MNEKRTALIDTETKYMKRSKSKGQPRSKHKHIYDTVLLHRRYHTTDLKTGKEKITGSILPTKVCTICGRIDKVDNDSSYYIKTQNTSSLFLSFEKTLSEKALELPKWYTEDYFDKYASKDDKEYI